MVTKEEVIAIQAHGQEVPTAYELQKEVFGPIVRVPDLVVDAINAIQEAGKALEARVESLEATPDNISPDMERDILYAMIEDNGKGLSEMTQQIHGLREQLQRFMGTFE